MQLQKLFSFYSMLLVSCFWLVQGSFAQAKKEGISEVSSKPLTDEEVASSGEDARPQCEAPQTQLSDFVHTVREGETLASIAQQYYGDPKKELILVSENGLLELGGAAIVVGMKVTIPFAIFHRVTEGETWNRLAARYYGDKRRAFVLVAANRSSIKELPHVGAEIAVPYPLRHVASQGDTLSKVASLYDERNLSQRMLRRFNRLRSNRLTQGQMVLVPLKSLTLSAQGRKIVRASSGCVVASGGAMKVQSELDQQIPELRLHVLQGRYLEAVAFGNQLMGLKEMTDNQRVTIQAELGKAYVALGHDDLATGAFQQVLRHQPFFVFDQVLTSPKVLKVFQDVRKGQAK